MARSRTNSTNQRRAPKKLDRRPAKKRVCIFCSENLKWVDYKDADLLRRYMSERAKIRGRRVSGNCRFHQGQVAAAIKLARELALLPYAQRQVTVRSKKPRTDRPPRADAPMPEPAGPPPSRRDDEGDFDEDDTLLASGEGLAEGLVDDLDADLDAGLDLGAETGPDEGPNERTDEGEATEPAVTEAEKAEGE